DYYCMIWHNNAWIF
nr:immunoglobulin light chain junction region [Macaca mulatta]MOX83483.1 immunoglobulin light chain junction region [Macaca mulatta]MOY06904.1 immunoglobulin light chain junction region [Macaca mulatta]MOY09191.1 immunoglobulin light chain junction region [Macaca mulatta]